MPVSLHALIHLILNEADDCELGDPGTVIISLVEDALSKEKYYILVSFLIGVSSLSEYNSKMRTIYDTGT